MTNTNKLKGRMVEKGYNISTLAKAMNLSRPTLRARITGNLDFKANEMALLRDLLDIAPEEVDSYFFN